MKIPSLKSVALFALFALSATACTDAPTGMNEVPPLAGSDTDGLLAADPLFRSIGPSFSLSTTTQGSDGLLTAAAETSDSRYLHAARRTNTLYKDEIKLAKVDPAKGATISLAGAGMSVVIPAGALPGTDVVVVTVQAYAGKYHVYEFLPHGIEFKKPVHVNFQIANVEAFGEELKKRLSELQAYQAEFEKCEAVSASGGKLSDTCQKLFLMWADYNEDAEWYKAALNADGFYGVYFKGDVEGGQSLPALEIFGVTLVGDELTFYTEHFSGYALGM